MDLKLTQALKQISEHMDTIQKLQNGQSNKESMQMASFKDENKSLKQQMFSIDKQFRAVEGALAD